MNLRERRGEKQQPRNQTERRGVAMQTAFRATKKRASHGLLSIQFSLLWKQFSSVDLNEI